MKLHRYLVYKLKILNLIWFLITLGKYIFRQSTEKYHDPYTPQFYIRVIKINHHQCSLFSDWLHPGGVRTFLFSNWSSCLLWKSVLIADWMSDAKGRTQLVEGRDAEQSRQRRGVEDAELTHPLRPSRTEYGEYREQKRVFRKLPHTRAKRIGPAGREMGSTACRC